LNGLMRDRSGTKPVSAAATGSIMRNVVWLVIVCLIGLGAVVAIKTGAAVPEGANVDRAKVGAVTGKETPNRTSSFQN
jgi:hypothetical protein